jgi:light-harvesting complex I chlorophyll a/b binding protein 1
VVEQRPGPIVSAVILIGIAELISGYAVTQAKATGDRAPGDFGFDPLRLASSEAKRKDYAEKEISNGRLAMWASAGILFQESVTSGSALSGGL